MSEQSPSDGVFGFEKLDVYQRSIEFLALAFQLGTELPRGQSALAEQLCRAALSIPLNIAEGAGRVGDADCESSACCRNFAVHADAHADADGLPHFC